MAAEQVESANMERLKDLLDDGKNMTTIRCQRCPSIVLNPKVSQYKQKEVILLCGTSFFKFQFGLGLGLVL